MKFSDKPAFFIGNVIFDEDDFLARVDYIMVSAPAMLEFHFTDGGIATAEYEPPEVPRPRGNGRYSASPELSPPCFPAEYQFVPFHVKTCIRFVSRAKQIVSRMETNCFTLEKTPVFVFCVHLNGFTHFLRSLM